MAGTARQAFIASLEEQAVPSVHVSYDVQYTVAVPAGQARGGHRQAPWAPLWDACRPKN